MRGSRSRVGGAENASNLKAYTYHSIWIRAKTGCEGVKDARSTFWTESKLANAMERASRVSLIVGGGAIPHSPHGASRVALAPRDIGSVDGLIDSVRLSVQITTAFATLPRRAEDKSLLHLISKKVFITHYLKL